MPDMNVARLPAVAFVTLLVLAVSSGNIQPGDRQVPLVPHDGPWSGRSSGGAGPATGLQGSFVPTGTGRSEVPAAVKAQAQAAYGKSPLHFEANQGQTDPEVKFLARGLGYTLFLTSTDAVLVLRQVQRQPSAKPDMRDTTKEPKQTIPTVVRMRLVGAHPTPQMVGLAELPGKAHYFLGKDPTKWRANIRTYAQVEHQQVYPGVNLVYYGTQRQLEYDFIVAPGADPGAITLAFDGADKLEVDGQGDLILQTRSGALHLHKPFVYQEVGGVKQAISGRYVFRRKNQIGFHVGVYDVSRPLIIDPVLDYSTYLGGSIWDLGSGIAVDTKGNAYVTGSASSTDFPTANPFQSRYGGGASDAFVTKLSPTGSALVYSTYLGGREDDFGTGIGVDAEGSAYVMGLTLSTDFPTTEGAFQPRYGGGYYDYFVTKLNPTGSALVYSSYLGGGDEEGETFGRSIAVDGAGHAYVTGGTSSRDFPTTAGAFGRKFNGYVDAFVTKVSPDGSALVYSTFLGGSNYDQGHAIAVDADGHAYVTGETGSLDFPLANPFQPRRKGWDAFVTKVTPDGSGLVYSSYLGGTDPCAGQSCYPDVGYGIAVDGSGHAYVTGATLASNFPVTPGVFQPTLGRGKCGSRRRRLPCADAFVTRVNPEGALVYSTYLGGSGWDSGKAIAVDTDGNAYVTGWTLSPDFPTVTPIQAAYRGGADAFVTKLNPTGSALVYSTYLGGSELDEGNGITVDTDGNTYVTGRTGSPDFPTVNPFQPRLRGIYYNAFITKIAETK